MSTEVDRSKRRQHRRPRLAVLRCVGCVAAFAVVLWGGYDRHWSWTGISGRTATLWDWLHLLLLPLAVAILPLWLSRKTRLPSRHKLLGLSVLFCFASLVIVGYVVPWAWTGFAGNRLWDWLELLVLPLSVALSPVVLELRGSWTRRHSLAGLTVSVGFAVVVVGGYVGNWRWTGFRGNTLWNWLHLWLLPLLIPVVVVPALRLRAMSGVTVLDRERRQIDQDQAPAEDAGEAGPQPAWAAPAGPRVEGGAR